MKLLKEMISKCRDCPMLADPENFCYKADKYINQTIEAIPDWCPLPDAEPEYCEWEYKGKFIDGERLGYKTSCGAKIYRYETDNYKFCPNCGKPIKIKEN
jgi:RNA polymerase-binding transcription factor DksA